MKADRETLRALMAAYLKEYGREGYDLHSFVDWCASAVLDVEQVPPGNGELIGFYQARIAANRAVWAGNVEVSARMPGGCCRQVVIDNFGELVELWDCAPGAERFGLSPEGRARVYTVPSVFRAERYDWTAEGRAVILAMRQGSTGNECRKAAGKDARGKSAGRGPAKAGGAASEAQGGLGPQASGDASGRQALSPAAQKGDRRGGGLA